MNGDTSLLVLAGNPPSDDLLLWRMEEADLSIAVDSGFLSFQKVEKLPDVLIGDLDSLPESGLVESKFPELQVVRLMDQDTTDFEKAINWIRKNSKTKNLVVLGALGKRTDHLITNLLLASVADEALQITFDDNHEWIFRVTPKCPLSIKGRRGAVLSILPLRESTGVQTEGLRWDLRSEKIGGDKIIGQSNVCLSDSVSISCESGSVFVFLEKK